MSRNILEQDEETLVIQRLERLISKGRHTRAYHTGMRYIGDLSGAAYVSVHIASATLLSARLCGKNTSRLETLLPKFRGYNDLIRGDNFRNAALHFIRKGELESAETMIQAARTLHKDDEDRMAALFMAEALLEMAKGGDKNAVMARTLHNRADDIWQSMRRRQLQVSEQLEMDNRFYYLRAMAALGYCSPSEFRKLIETEPRLNRRLRARLMHAFPKFGYNIDRRIFER